MRLWGIYYGDHDFIPTYYPLKKKYHPFHIVDPSPWPILVSFQLFVALVNTVSYFHRYNSFEPVFYSFFFLAVIIFYWITDVIYEGTYLGHHTLAVQNSLRFGFVLFLVSEIMFFISFFWAFFHSSLSPSIWIGAVWPPLGIIPLSPWKVPLLNTCLLLLSGVTVTWCQACIIRGDSIDAQKSLKYTIFLGLIFTLIQIFEYVHTSFSITDGIFGSLFFMMTGFHGIHVIIGTIFLIVALLRLQWGHFTKQHHVGFEIAAWYWHFVDVVWLFLYAFVYVWTSVYL